MMGGYGFVPSAEQQGQGEFVEVPLDEAVALLVNNYGGGSWQILLERLAKRGVYLMRRQLESKS